MTTVEFKDKVCGMDDLSLKAIVRALLTLSHYNIPSDLNIRATAFEHAAKRWVKENDESGG